MGKLGLNAVLLSVCPFSVLVAAFLVLSENKGGSRLKTFQRGIHPPERKELSRDCAIEIMPPPRIVKIPLSQHIGAECMPLVRTGDPVKKGQLIGSSDKTMSAGVFASVSGTVVGFESIRTAPGGNVGHVVIENDFAETEERLSELRDPSPLDIVERIREAGIVGMGGASFPLTVKLTPPKNKPIDILVINAAECEPYITCDDRVMREYPEQFAEGCRLLGRALKAERIVVGIEENKPEAIEVLRAVTDLELCVLKTKYPQGAEKQLIYAVTGRKVPAGGLPMDVGVVVDNVHTAFSTYRAVREGKTCYERVMTVSGDAVANPKNLWVRTGTPYEDLLDYCGGLKEEAVKIVSGGPMMGFAQYDLKPCTAKATSALLFLTEGELNTEKPSACINCARCHRACPMNLMPMYIDASIRADDPEGAKRYGAMNCMECGCCTYVCPAKRPIIQSIRLAKRLIKQKKL